MRLEGLEIGFVAGTLARGGAERQLFYILQALIRSGARPRLWCLTRDEPWEGQIRNLGVPVRWFGRSPLRPGRLLALVSSLRKSRVRLVQSQHFYTNLYAAGAARIHGLAEAGALRNDCASEVAASGAIGKWGLRLPRQLVANSRGAIRKAAEMGVPASRLHHLPNVVDVESFACDRGNRDAQPVRVLAVGRLEHQKRFDRLLLTLAAVRRRGTLFEARIVGDGSLREQLEARARELDLVPPAVEFHGQTADMREQYAWADMLVQSSDHEGTPNVVLEAMASGLPVVATAAGDTAEICPHGEAGLVVEPSDERDLLKALETVAASSQLRSRMGRAALANVRGRFSVERLPALLDTLYGEMGLLG